MDRTAHRMFGRNKNVNYRIKGVFRVPGLFREQIAVGA